MAMSSIQGGATLSELFEVLVRTAHIVASAAWLGGGLFYAFVLGPRLRGLDDARRVSPAIGLAFGKVVSACAWTLLATGGYLTFDRLTNTRLAAPYVLLLALKVALAVWMFLLVGALARARGRPPALAVSARGRWREVMPVPRLLLALGLAVFLLSAAITTIYQATPTVPVGPGG